MKTKIQMEVDYNGRRDLPWTVIFKAGQFSTKYDTAGVLATVRLRAERVARRLEKQNDSDWSDIVL